MDGLEVLRRIRARPAPPPVAILDRACRRAANTIEAMRLGAFDHLTKPFGRDDLARLVLTRMLRAARPSAAAAAPAAEATTTLIGSSAAMRAGAEADRPRSPTATRRC